MIITVQTTFTAFNPHSTEYVRQKYRTRMEHFKQQCNLVNYLSKVMGLEYQNPPDQPIDFSHKMCAFLKLKETA